MNQPTCVIRLMACRRNGQPTPSNVTEGNVTDDLSSNLSNTYNTAPSPKQPLNDVEEVNHNSEARTLENSTASIANQRPRVTFATERSSRFANQAALSNVSDQEDSPASTTSILIRLEEQIKVNLVDIEVLQQAAEIARRNDKRQLAEEITRLRVGVIARGLPSRAMRRKLKRRIDEEESRAMKQWVPFELVNNSFGKQASVSEEYGKHLPDEDRERLHEWLDGVP